MKYGVMSAVLMGALAGLAIIQTDRVAHAQSKTCQLVENMPDGSVVVNCAGLEYRGLNPEQMRAFGQTKIDLDEAKGLLAIEQKTTAAQQAAIDAQDVAIVQCNESTKQTLALIESQNRLLIKIDSTAARVEAANRASNEATQAALDALRPGRIAKLQQNPFFSVANDYFIRPGVTSLFNKWAGCR